MLVAVLFASATHVAMADVPNGDDQREFAVIVGATNEFDGNVFRLPDSTAPQAALGVDQKSDWIHQGLIGVHINKAYSQQTAQLEATFSRYFYEKFSFLDFNALNLDATWLWHFTPRVQGLLTADRKQDLVDYGDYRNYSQRNIVTTDSYRFTFDWQLVGGWHSMLGINEVGQKNSTPFTEEASNRLYGGEAGLKYVFRSLNSIAVIGQQSYGRKLDQPADPGNLLDNEFRQHVAQLRLEIPTQEGYTFDDIQARAGYIWRSNPHFPQRDYSGFIAQAEGAWNITAKTQLAAVAGEDIATYETSYSSYFNRKTIGVGPSWKGTNKLRIYSRFTWNQLNYHGAVSSQADGRQDIIRTYRIGVDWAPTRSTSVSWHLQSSKRGSTYVPVPYQYDDLNTSLDLHVLF